MECLLLYICLSEYALNRIIDTLNKEGGLRLQLSHLIHFIIVDLLLQLGFRYSTSLRKYSWNELSNTLNIEALYVCI